MSTLCKVCSTIFLKERPPFRISNPTEEQKAILSKYDLIQPTVELEWHPLHKSRWLYEQGLSYGCELCLRIASIAPAAPADFQTSFVLQHNKLSITRISHSLPSPHSTLSFELRSFVTKSDPVEMHRVALSAIVSGGTGSHAAFRLASKWLADCTTNHRRCSHVTQPSWYPTRLLEIMGDRVRLVVTAEHKMCGAYFTLSHCWGTVPPKLKLTRQTEGYLRDGLDIDLIQPTYCDALIATRELGSNYLWIDLFCIFQGRDNTSAQDWERESVVMDRVYAGGLLNISATHAKNGNAGCFKHLFRTTNMTRIVVLWKMYQVHRLTYYKLLEPTAQLIVTDDPKSPLETAAPTNGRGWIVQERLLSPRVL